MTPHEEAIRDALYDLQGSGWGSAMACLPAGGVECEALVERTVDRLRESIGLPRMYDNSPATMYLKKYEQEEKEKQQGKFLVVAADGSVHSFPAS
jgi:hypothetical protein